MTSREDEKRPALGAKTATLDSSPSALINIEQFQELYPNFTFKKDRTFMWSPQEETIYYDPERMDKQHGVWSLLHEIGHALAGHTEFSTDIQLIKIEVEAWRFAKKIGHSLEIIIDEDHIQDCLDSYRDWLHKRSRCPECRQINPQAKAFLYSCFNCGTKWKVSASQLCSVRSRA